MNKKQNLIVSRSINLLKYLIILPFYDETELVLVKCHVLRLSTFFILIIHGICKQKFYLVNYIIFLYFLLTIKCVQTWIQWKENMLLLFIAWLRHMKFTWHMWFFPFFFIADALLCHSFFHSQGQHAIGVFGTDVLNLLFTCLLSYPCSELTSYNPILKTSMFLNCLTLLSVYSLLK